MMVFKKAIPRRMFLRGSGAALALPLLDSMVPAMAATSDKPPVRLSFLYVPNGIIMEKWTPKSTSTSLELMPTLEPLRPYRDQVLMLTGLSNPRAPGEVSPTGPHAGAAGTYFTGVNPKPPGQAGISVDQIAAQAIGKHTQLSSMELTLDSGEQGAGADGADSDAYLNTLSWRSATSPLPMENNPRRVFERLFGQSDNSSTAERLKRVRRNRSILDSVRTEISRLSAKVGAGDRGKLDEYLESIRDVERRVQLSEAQMHRELPPLARPAGIPPSYEDHAKLMFDLQTLALQTDMTRVVTLAMAREKSERAYREIGIDEGHHAISHHGYDPVLMEKVSRINLYHSRMFTYFLNKLRTTADGDGSLLDHSIIMYSSSMSDGMAHNRANLPILLIGGGAGQIKGGRHIRYEKNPSVRSLFLTLLDCIGVAADKIGDSSSKLDFLSVA